MEFLVHHSEINLKMHLCRFVELFSLGCFVQPLSARDVFDASGSLWSVECVLAHPPERAVLRSEGDRLPNSQRQEVLRRSGDCTVSPPGLTRETASSEGWEIAPQAPRPHTDRDFSGEQGTGFCSLKTAEYIGGKPHNEMDPTVKCVPMVFRWFLVVSLSLGSWCWSASTVRVLALKVRRNPGRVCRVFLTA